jgi:hypothetical protein
VAGPATVPPKSPPSVLQYENPDHTCHDCQGQVIAKGKAKECDMRIDYAQHHEYGDPCAPVDSMSLLWSHRSYCEHEVQTADAHGSALDTAQSRFLEQRHDVARIDVTMTVEMREEA